MIVQWQSSLLELFPVKVFGSYTLLYHGNAIGNRAHELAKVAAHTFLLLYCIRVVRLAIRKADGLVRCILAGNVAKAAVNAFVLIYVGDVMIVDVKVFPMRDGWHTFADEIINGFKTFFIHVVI